MHNQKLKRKKTFCIRLITFQFLRIDISMLSVLSSRFTHKVRKRKGDTKQIAILFIIIVFSLTHSNASHHTAYMDRGSFVIKSVFIFSFVYESSRIHTHKQSSAIPHQVKMLCNQLFGPIYGVVRKIWTWIFLQKLPIIERFPVLNCPFFRNSSTDFKIVHTVEEGAIMRRSPYTKFCPPRSFKSCFPYKNCECRPSLRLAWNCRYRTES